MSAIASLSKTVTANTILYKKAKDVPRLPTIAKSDPCRTLSGFKAVPGFTKRRDPMRNDEWEGYEESEREALVRGYWRVYDQEHNELEALYSSLARKEAAELESRRMSEEKKKKKSKLTAPIASGSGSGKGKDTEVEVIDDSESDANTKFRETCIGCEHAKVKCIFTHASNSKKVACDQCVSRKTNCTYQSPQDLVVQKELKALKRSIVSLDGSSEIRNRLQAEGLYHQYNLQVISSLQWSLNTLSSVDTQEIGLRRLNNQLLSDMSVPEELQDAVQHGRSHVIERYNNIALMCGVQMKSISSRYGLGKGFEGWIPMLNPYGELDLRGEAGSGKRRRREKEDNAERGPSKKVRTEKEPESGEKEVEKEVGPDAAPLVDKGKGKERESTPDGNEEDTMKE
ncbi:hypothetical protein M422DRAFT_274323 [Sphaerobolus stellatus SS14]|uniref:Zn(2)-C6 fungal-type domain-containing protein n=1 Tax=Sphaerobolus stellatus (strain SS14) TaxID=990650 RepID=A0A0C9UHY9_SPHS4|nr:hypothetical protein M422DRAFT_274323 [Sphaerobolus stellatus SS14]